VQRLATAMLFKATRLATRDSPIHVVARTSRTISRSELNVIELIICLKSVLSRETLIVSKLFVVKRRSVIVVIDIATIGQGYLSASSEHSSPNLIK
jgi:hypothetical protein